MNNHAQINNNFDNETRAFREKQWVRSVREEGDRSAFEKIFRAYYRRLYGFAYEYVKSSHDAEDVVQTVFLNIWKQKESWEAGGTVKQYLFTAVRNRALNEIRNKKIRDDAEDEVIRFMGELKSRTRSEDNEEAKILQKAIQEGIGQLPDRKSTRL